MDALRDWWHVIVTLVAVVVFGVRTEAQSKSNSREIQALKEQRKEDREADRSIIAEVRADVKDLRADIKELLRRGD
jgi:hypothetical protein